MNKPWTRSKQTHLAKEANKPIKRELETSHEQTHELEANKHIKRELETNHEQTHELETLKKQTNPLSVN